MSTGHGAWESRIDIGLQGGVASLPSDWYTLQIDSSDSLGFNTSMLDRNPVYGSRTRPAEAYKKDTELPAGDLGAWALRMDEDSRGFLMMLDMFYQRHAVVSGGTLTQDEWTFSPIGTYSGASDLHLYAFRKVVGDGSTQDETYLDGIASSMAWSWSTGNALTLSSSIQSLSASYGAVANDGTLFTGVVISTPEIFPTIGINGTTYTLYPSSMDATEDNNMPDSNAAGVTQRPRLIIGGHTGELSMTLPRDSFLGKVEAAVDSDYMGTFKMEVRPSSGTYSTGGGTLYADYQAYIKFDKPPAPAGGDGELTFDLTGQMVEGSQWLVGSELASI